MLTDKIKQNLVEMCKKDKSRIVFDVSLSDKSTMGVGGNVDAWFVPGFGSRACEC